MGKLGTTTDNMNGMDYQQVDASHPNNDSPDLPMDLSRYSTVHPFYRRSMSSDDPPMSPMDLSERIPRNIGTQISTDIQYEAPEIIIQPKLEWHYRSMKDLEKKHIPLLSGDGPQRTPIRVRISVMPERQVYLKIAILTHNDESHPSKVIVPAKTKVKVQKFSHDNNLDCLQFDECYHTDRFDPINRHIYLEISSAEREAQFKDVRIHMFNLYQSQIINKEMIEAKLLNLCKLSFTVCRFDNGCYIPVSRTSLSSIIQEKKTPTRSRISQQIPSQVSIPDIYSPSDVECLTPDDTDDENSRRFVFSTIKSS